MSLISFRQILPKTLPVAHIFSFIISAYLKKFSGIKSFSTKQCPANLSLQIIPLVFLILPKMSPSFHLGCCPHHVWTALPLLENCWGNPVVKSCPAAKNCCSPCRCIIFLTSAFMYRNIMLILISRWLLNLIFSMTKALNGQNPSNQNFQLLFLPYNPIWKTLLQLFLVFLFAPSILFQTL